MEARRPIALKSEYWFGPKFVKNGVHGAPLASNVSAAPERRGLEFGPRAGNGPILTERGSTVKGNARLGCASEFGAGGWEETLRQVSEAIMADAVIPLAVRAWLAFSVADLKVARQAVNRNRLEPILQILP